MLYIFIILKLNILYDIFILMNVATAVGAI